MDFFDRKHIIITGGTSGIGKAIALRLVRRGADVSIIARRQSLLEQTIAEFEEHKARPDQTFRQFSADLSNWEEAQSAIETLTADAPPDVLINSAGYSHPGYFEELPVEVFQRIMAVDFFGTLYPCKLVVPLMIERGSGHIVNVSSVAGFLGVFGFTAYSAAKFAIRGFSDTLRQELKPYGVHVSIVYPPDTDTPLLHYEDGFKPLETKRLSGNAGLLTADEVARAVVKGIEKKRYVITPGFESTLFFWLTNPIFTFVNWYMDWVIAKARREKAQDGRQAG